MHPFNYKREACVAGGLFPGEGGGGYSLYGPYGETLAKRGTFFRLEVNNIEG